MPDVQRTLSALSSPIRREILALIAERDLPAGEIAAAFHVTAPTISQHLAVLRDAGLVTMEVDGNFRRYRARRDALRSLHATLWVDSSKWTPADDLPESNLAAARTSLSVIAHVDVPTDQATTFTAFIDPAVFSRWLGVPVTIDANGRFAADMEFGTRVRGNYDEIAAPDLIALRWDFEDDNTPIPGGEMTGYVRFSTIESGTRVEVHQLVDTPAQAEFMETAWTMVLGRLKTGVASASNLAVDTPARAPRPKRRRSA
jgi:DNA-binding transcriptional ArsR family regulator